jgi:glycosyltransferase involved in cell wall biosynthesis
LSAGTIVFSEPVLRYVEGDNSFGRPVHLVPYGIDPHPPFVERATVRKELDLASDSYVWITVGRLTRQKGFDLLIEAFNRLRRTVEMPSVLLFVGDGEEREALQKLAAGLVSEGVVKFLGQRDDVPNLLGASDAFVLSSHWEGGPLVILEAMAAGLPVVATRVGDVGKMVVEGKTGVDVPPGNPEILSGAMERIMNLGLESSQWGEAGKERVQAMFHYSQTQRLMEEAYLELTGLADG